ncbi:MAG: Cu(I)/Ag(I) efflux system membrane fusion protein [Paraglaciecola sp.]|jgi:Cu(I)/Ag(I) efflux system membrane fusion protein
MNSKIALFMGIILGSVVTAGIYAYRAEDPQSINSVVSTTNDKPIYWVAPMDANFRRDQPGKSPMGMDLVAVYATGNSDMSQGTVRISPDVVNNLGVRTAKVVQQALHIPINTVGYVQYNEDNLVHIHPRVAGWVEKLYVKAAGDKVTQNQALYALYSPQLVNAQEEYLLARRRKNDALSNAAEARLLALQMPQEAIDLLKRSQKVQQTVQFRAPQSGVVDNLAIREGFYVKPGTTLMSIGGLDEVWVEAEIFERQASQVSKDLPVTMTLGYLPGKSWQGKVDYIYPTLNPTTRTVRVRLRFANQDRLLKPNMFAQVTIHSDLNEQSLLVPRESVIRTGKQDRVVMALGQGKFKSVEVKLGQVSGDFAQILSGLQEGDEIVTSAQFLLDSESSISSDFVRMSHGPSERVKEDEQGSMAAMPVLDPQQAQGGQFAQVDGLINHINSATRLMNISRGAIEKWQRGPATLDFVAAQSVDISKYRAGDMLSFTFEVRGGEFVIIKATLLSAGNLPVGRHIRKSVEAQAADTDGQNRGTAR